MSHLQLMECALRLILTPPPFCISCNGRDPNRVLIRVRSPTQLQRNDIVLDYA
jgi:hypothetical protein